MRPRRKQNIKIGISANCGGIIRTSQHHGLAEIVRWSTKVFKMFNKQTIQGFFTAVCLLDLGFRLFVGLAHGHVKEESRTSKLAFLPIVVVSLEPASITAQPKQYVVLRPLECLICRLVDSYKGAYCFLLSRYYANQTSNKDSKSAIQHKFERSRHQTGLLFNFVPFCPKVTLYKHQIST